jgi:small-conductance mechanosensitive channel
MNLLERLNLWFFNEGLNLVKLIFVTLVLIRVLRWATNRAHKWAADATDPQRLQQIKTTAGALEGLGQVVILGFAAATGLREIGLDVRPMLAGAGVIGLALGLGAQNVVRDTLSGAFILLDNQFGVGDTIRTGTITGTVEMMSLRRTVIRDGEGAAYNIPNGEIRIVANLTRSWSQVSFSVPVAANQPVDRVLEILTATGKELAANSDLSVLLLEAPRVLGVENIAGQKMEILLQVRVSPGRQADIAREWRRLIMQAFDAAGIPFQDLRMVMVASTNGVT